jgi:hypothetical protein
MQLRAESFLYAICKVGQNGIIGKRKMGGWTCFGATTHGYLDHLYTLKLSPRSLECGIIEAWPRDRDHTVTDMPPSSFVSSLRSVVPRTMPAVFPIRAAGRLRHRTHARHPIVHLFTSRKWDASTTAKPNARCASAKARPILWWRMALASRASPP